MIGGNCNLAFTISNRMKPDQTRTAAMPFRIRGKNPRDNDVITLANQHAPNCTDIVWAIFRRETRQGERIYNHFNSRNTPPNYSDVMGTPNRGAPDGWGIGQIDRTPDGITTTVETWNWRTNVIHACQILEEKRANQIRYLRCIRFNYNSHTNWQEPPDLYTIGQTTLSSISWGTIVLYNGATDSNMPETILPRKQYPTDVSSFLSPWFFNVTTGEWTFYDNARKYATEEVRPEIETPRQPQE